MESRQEWVERAKTKLDEWNAELDELEGKARAARAERKAQYERVVGSLREYRDEAREKLAEIQSGGDAAWSEAREGLQRSWTALSEGFRAAIDEVSYAVSEAEKNAETVRRGYAAFNSADMETLTEIFDENASWHTPGRGPLAGDHEGREAAFAQFGRYVGETEGTFKATLLHLLRSDDGRVVGVHHNSAERDGKHLDVGCCIVFEFKDGRIIDGREHFYDLHAWDEFWS